ncbi:MAG: hypothetical protein KF900_06770 [Bacteroidetes bacterium]|nr:hypothetical protein [Bacteroidota bacterium]
MAQVKERKLYKEISPNYTFSKIKINDEKINVRNIAFPAMSFGAGYFLQFKSNFFVDVSCSYHLLSYHYASNLFGGESNNVVFAAPKLNVQFGLITGNSSKYKLMAGIGGSLSYSIDDELIKTINDSITQTQLIAESKRYKMVTSFLNISSGIFVYGKKRNYMINVSYSYSFQVPYYVTYTYTEQQSVYRSEIVGRDSFVQLQFKWFLKNRKV